jgi:integrase
MEYRLVYYRGSWAATWRERGNTRRLALRTKDRGEAERRLADFLAGERRAPATVKDIIRTYLDRPEQRRRKAQELLLKAPLAYFGNMRPDQITDSLTRRYWASRAVKDGTIRTELQTLIAALNYCDSKGFKVPLPAAGKPRERVLTRAEVKAIIKAARASGRHLRMFIAILISTGSRKTAILQLTWDRVDLERNRVDFRRGDEAGNKRRVYLPMNKRLRRYMRIAARIRTCDHVIEYAGRPVLDVKKGLKMVFDRAGVHDASAHTVRHTVASWMVERGVPLQDVAAFLGDTVATVERVYAKFAPDYLSTAARALE